MKKSDAEDTEGVMGFEPAEHISTHHHMAIPWQDFFTNDNQIKVLYIGQCGSRGKMFDSQQSRQRD